MSNCSLFVARFPETPVTTADRRLAPRKTPRQLRSRQTRERILAAAARVFSERGYAGGTTNHIAAEAGVSVGSLYQYFPNKDALLAELMRAHVDEGTTRVAASLAAATADGTTPAADPSHPGADHPAHPRTTAGGTTAAADPSRPHDLEGRLRPFVDAAVDNHRGDPRLHRVLFEEAPRPPALVRELHALEDAVVAAVADLLRGDPDVEVPDADLAAWFVVAAIESLTHRYIGSHTHDGHRDGAVLDLYAFSAELVRLLAAYLRAGRGT
jgi:AcrR family transcriptional regulator